MTAAWHSVQMVSRFKQRVDFVWLDGWLCLCLSMNTMQRITSLAHFFAHTLDITLHPSIVLAVVNALPFCDTVTYVCFSDESIGKCVRSHIHRNWRKKQKKGYLQAPTNACMCVCGICPHACEVCVHNINPSINGIKHKNRLEKWKQHFKKMSSFLSKTTSDNLKNT